MNIHKPAVITGMESLQLNAPNNLLLIKLKLELFLNKSDVYLLSDNNFGYERVGWNEIEESDSIFPEFPNAKITYHSKYYHADVTCLKLKIKKGDCWKQLYV